MQCVSTASPVFGQARKDGWATYYKFLFWRLDSFFDQVLFIDADALLLVAPTETLFARARASSTVFLASQESHGGYGRSCTGGCTAAGLNTHLMLLRPNRTVYRELLQKAITQDYIPYTNTEQVCSSSLTS